MAKYIVTYRYIFTHETEVEADSEDQAKEIVDNMGVHELVPPDPNGEELEITGTRKA